MSERSWKWFKHGHQFDVVAKAKDVRGKFATPSITVFTEHKDKQDARRIAMDELNKHGYTNVEITKVVSR